MLKSLLPAFFLLFFTEINAQEPRLVAQTGHPAKMTDAAITNDGKFIITVSTDKTAILWNALTHRQLSIFRPDRNDATEDQSDTKVLLSPDEKNILIYNDERVSPNGEATSVICRLPDLKQIGHLAPGITRAAFSPDGKYLAGGDNYGGLRIYSAVDFKLLYTSGIAKTGTFGEALLSLTKGINPKDTAKLKQRFMDKMTQDGEVMEDAESELSGLWFSPDSRFVLTAGAKGRATKWNIQTGVKVFLKGNTEDVIDGAFSPNGKWIVTGANDSTVCLWNAAACIKKYRINVRARVVKVLFSPASTYDPAGGRYIIVLLKENDALILNSGDGHTVQQLEDKYSKEAFYTPDGKSLITDGKTWQAETFKQGPGGSVFEFYQYSANKKYLVTGSSDYFYLSNPLTVESISQFRGFDSQNGTVSLSGINADNQLMVKDWQNTTPISASDATSGMTEKNRDADIDYTFSPDKHYKYEMSPDGDGKLLKIINVETHQTITSLKSTEDFMPVPVFFSPESKLAAILNPTLNKNAIDIIDLNMAKKINEINGYFMGYSSFFSPDSKYTVIVPLIQPKPKKTDPNDIKNATSMNDMINIAMGSVQPQAVVVDVLNGKVRSTLQESPGAIFSTIYSPANAIDPVGGKILVTVGRSLNGKIVAKIWDPETGKLLGSMLDDDHPFQTVLISPDAKFVFTDSGEGFFKQWDASNGKYLSTFYPGKDGQGSFQLTAKGYYQGDKSAAANMYYVTKNFKILSADGNDIKFNRPDKVLEATGSTDKALIGAYKNAYVARLKDLHINPATVKKLQPVPDITIVSEDYEVTEREYPLHIKAKSGLALQRLSLWINKVPVYGSKGLLFKGRAKKAIDTTLNIILSAGGREERPNEIEVSVTNINGVESGRAQLLLKYKAERGNSHLHFIGIAVNEYADKNENLNWSINDIRKLAEGLKFNNENMTIDTLFGKDVSRANIHALKKRLKDLDVESRVVIAYAGHGINVNRVLYLPTYATNFKIPQASSIPYTDLEDLFDGIPPRQKLMLIDACNSGDYDKSNTNSNERRQAILAKNSYELMRDIFANADRGTGATVIAACGVSRSSMAQDSLKHGVFTYSVLEAVFGEQKYLNFLTKNKEFDSNPYSVSALKEYIKLRVPELSDNAQIPIIRSENAAVNWSF